MAHPKQPPAPTPILNPQNYEVWVIEFKGDVLARDQRRVDPGPLLQCERQADGLVELEQMELCLLGEKTAEYPHM